MQTPKDSPQYPKKIFFFFFKGHSTHPRIFTYPRGVLERNPRVKKRHNCTNIACEKVGLSLWPNFLNILLISVETNTKVREAVFTTFSEGKLVFTDSNHQS